MVRSLLSQPHSTHSPPPASQRSPSAWGPPRDGAQFHTSAGSRAPILLDTDRVLYRRLGLYRNTIGRPHSLASGLELLTSLIERTPKAVARQSGGAFLVTPGGRVVAEQRSRRPTDIVTNKAINQMLRQLRTARAHHAPT
ncbi:AhpC/TSA family protein [Nocardia suismassiliense]|uniref:AhpC/TSA family protein n=1 Tax=Nocardia suismassiliense TaxID=2077092 RepID=UPI0038990BBF